MPGPVTKHRQTVGQRTEKRTIKLGRRIIFPFIAYHWAVKVGGTWYEVSIDDKSKTNIIERSTGYRAKSWAGMLGGGIVGKTEKSGEAIKEWTDSWQKKNPNYNVMRDNCQTFSIELMKWLTNGNYKCTHRMNAGTHEPRFVQNLLFLLLVMPILIGVDVYRALAGGVALSMFDNGAVLMAGILFRVGVSEEQLFFITTVVNGPVLMAGILFEVFQSGKHLVKQKILFSIFWFIISVLHLTMASIFPVLDAVIVILNRICVVVFLDAIRKPDTRKMAKAMLFLWSIMIIGRNTTHLIIDSCLTEESIHDILCMIAKRSLTGYESTGAALLVVAGTMFYWYEGVYSIVPAGILILLLSILTVTGMEHRLCVVVILGLVLLLWINSWNKSGKGFVICNGGNAISYFAAEQQLPSSYGPFNMKWETSSFTAQAVAGPGLGVFLDMVVVDYSTSLGNFVGVRYGLNVNTGIGIRNGNIEAHVLGLGGKVGADGVEINTPGLGVNACSIM